MMRRIFFDKSLKLEVNVIGYKNQGESILFFVWADESIAYTGLVDCYKEKQCDAIVDILVENGINKLDFVCWTHPHDDHSKGLDEILVKYCTAQTLFWIADIIPDRLSLYSEACKKMYNRIREIHKSNNEDKVSIRYASDSTQMERCIFSSTHQYEFKIQSFAPNSTILAEQTVLNRDQEGNKYSVGLFIFLGEFSIMLAGDVENLTFERIDDFSIEYPVDYIKIPHHGSPSASKLVERMKSLSILAPDIAVTTLYCRGGIPKADVLDKYKRWGTEYVISAGDYSNPENNKKAYGRIKTTFDILKKSEYPIETELLGNALLV